MGKKALSQRIYLASQKILFDIEVIKKPGGSFSVIEANNVGCGSDFKRDIFEYNDAFSKIVAENASLEYLISPTLTRIEGATLFYDKAYKFAHFVNQIETGEENLRIVNLDYKVTKALVRYLREKGIIFRHTPLKLFFETLRRNIVFSLRLLILPVLEAFYAASSRVLLKAPRARSYDYAIYSYYDYRSHADGRHREEYLRSVPEHMTEKGKRLIVLHKLLHYNSIALFMKYVLMIKESVASYEVNVYQRFITPKDIIKALLSGLSKRVRLRERVVFKGVDISRLTSLALDEDFQGMNWFYTYLEYYFIRKILKNYSLGSVLYPYENHPWEKAIAYARNELRSPTRLAGFQHTSFSFKLIHHFPGRHEKNLPIYPDKILTAGRILKEVLTEYGNYPERIVREGCALRHPYLFEGAVKPGKVVFSRKIAYAFSFDITNYNNILDNLVRIFGYTDITVYLKLHPDVIGAGFSFDSAPPENFVIATGIPWERLFETIDILLYDDNSLGIEALRYNITVGYFGLTGQTYNTDRLFKYEGTKIEASTVEEFKAAIEAYYRQDAALLMKDFDYKQRYLYDYFTPITPEGIERFL